MVRQARCYRVDVVHASVPTAPLADQVPQVAVKCQVEQRLAASSMSSLALRLAPFTVVIA